MLKFAFLPNLVNSHTKFTFLTIGLWIIRCTNSFQYCIDQLKVKNELKKSMHVRQTLNLKFKLFASQCHIFPHSKDDLWNRCHNYGIGSQQTKMLGFNFFKACSFVYHPKYLLSPLAIVGSRNFVNVIIMFDNKNVYTLFTSIRCDMECLYLGLLEPKIN